MQPGFFELQNRLHYFVILGCFWFRLITGRNSKNPAKHGKTHKKRAFGDDPKTLNDGR